MKLIINGRLTDTKELISSDFDISKSKLTLEPIVQAYEEKKGLNYDVLLVNGFIASKETDLSDMDEVILIKRGVMPEESEMEALMCGRHTPKVHEKLKASTVAICGLGGLGSNIATALARIGVGRLILIDFDVVEPSNLNRQSYEIADIGKLKCEALTKGLERINPYNTYVPINRKIEKTDVDTLFEGVDVVVEAFDNPSTRQCLSTKSFKRPIGQLLGHQAWQVYTTQTRLKPSA